MTRTITKKTDSSGGLTIPAELLDEAALGKEVELVLDGNSLVVRPAGYVPHQGWFDGYE